MTYLHTYIDEVAETAGRLAGKLTRDIPGPTENIPLYSNVDAAMGKLGEAYRELAAAFDDLPE
jgi:hypothetical protein